VTIAEDTQVKSGLLRQLRDAAAKCVRRSGSENAFLDEIARSVFHADQYHKLSTADLTALLTYVQRRAAARESLSRPASEPAPAAYRAAFTALRPLVSNDVPSSKATRAQARPGGN
jgi:hypothetical protein